MEKKERNYNIDFIKILACFFVVAIHTQRNYQLSIVHNSILYYLSRCAVPLFMMVNGYLLLSKEKIDYKYITKKVKKILAIIVFWVILYSILDSLRKFKFVNPLNIFIGIIVQNSPLVHLWFLIALIFIYLLLPLFYKLNIFENKNKFSKILVGIIVSNIIIDCVFNYYYINFNINILKLVPQCFRIWIWIMYFFIGGYINRYSRKLKMNTIFLIILSIIVYIYQYELFIKIHYTINSEYIYSNIIVIFWCITIFKFIENIKLSYKFIFFIELFSKYTMGIYILHPMIINILDLSYHTNGYIYSIIMWICAIFISYICSIIIDKIPLLNKSIKL